MLKRINIVLFIALCLLSTGCKEDPERHFNLGNWYYHKGLVDDAILEYREVIRLYPLETRLMEREEIDLVAKAHYNLAIAYSKKGWYDYALKEAETTFEIWPTKENYDMVELLKKRRSLEQLKIETEA
jgi:tetratricopeptide (TPR) repeat protein|tara:strand:- start:5229 stop:5612 length:384 start_codon:yes stop_codon:yes gene_type:complete